MRHKRLIVASAAVIAVTLSAVIGTHLGGVAGATPTAPPLANPGVPYVDADGVINRHAVPQWMPVYGLGGATVGWVRGVDVFANDGRHVTIYSSKSTTSPQFGNLDP